MAKESSVIAVILTYNALPHLCNVIDAVLQQTYPLSKVIVVDNNSQDGTETALKTYGDKIEVIRHNSNVGVGAGHNAGWQTALHQDGCDLIWVLEHDCVPARNCLEALVHAYTEFSASNRIGVCVPFQAADYRHDEKERYVWLRNSFRRVKKRTVNGVNSLGGGFTFNGVLISTCVIKDVGMLNTNFFVGREDTEYRERVKDAGYKILQVPSAIVSHDILRARREFEFLGKGFLIPNTSILRSYYEKRNTLFLAKQRTGVAKLILGQVLKLPLSLVFILLLQDKKSRRIQARIYAIRDGLRSDLGPKSYTFLKEHPNG